MAPNLKDPKITAYVLDELSDNEKKEFETRMMNDPLLRKAVEDIRETTEILHAELDKESVAKFEIVSPIEKTPKQNSSSKESKSFNWIRFLSWGTAGLAAASLAVVLVTPQFQNFKERQSRVAVNDNSVPSSESKVASNEGSGTKADKSGQRVQPGVSAMDPNALASSVKKEVPKTPMADPVGRKRTTISFRDQNAQGAVAPMEESDMEMSPSRPKPTGSYLMSQRRESRVKGGRALGFGGHGAVAKKKRVAPAPQPVDRLDDSFVAEKPMNTEEYNHIQENQFKKVLDHPLSTFSIDVDTASYANMRRFLNQGMMPPKDSVRIEEMVNYFSYEYEAPKDDKPFAVHVDMAKSPWSEGNHLLKIGLKGKDIKWNSKGSNLVFLLDVSGSMGSADKLPLVKKAMRLLIDNLTGDDRIAIVVYAGSSGLVLPSTSGNDKDKILSSLDRLNAGGSTNGGAGIELAYKVAAENFIKGGVNRVILATDGDFNVGVSSQGSLVRLIQEKAKTKVFLSVLGFGRGNLSDARMESLANKGNGNYSYIDSVKEAKKVLVEEMGGTLVTIAKDVKLQLEFNPSKVAGYRLVGYENRMLAKEDFNNDKKDAGELGAGHRVTAIYEIIPAGKKVPGSVDKLKYQAQSTPKVASSNEWLTVKLRYKKPEGSKSTLIEVPFKGEVKDFAVAGADFKFASAVAGFGMLLRGSKHAGTANYDSVREWAIEGQGADSKGYRKELIELIQKAKQISGK